MPAAKETPEEPKEIECAASTWPQRRSIRSSSWRWRLTPDAPAPFCVNRDQEQWEAITSKENLDINIIDVYAEWCGPCKSIPQGERSALRPAHSCQRLS